MRGFRFLAVVLAACALVGCIQPFRLEVRQGNVVTQEMVQLLEPGMTRSQVRFALGTPLVTDPFHQQRWDYVYLYKEHAGAPAETRRLTVIFDGDRLVRVEGDAAPPAGLAGGGSRAPSDGRRSAPPPG